jgi:hypothetical protein
MASAGRSAVLTLAQGTPCATAKLQGRIGFAGKPPECIPAKADAAAQRAYLETALPSAGTACQPQLPRAVLRHAAAGRHLL